jgi:hypothetical protein
MIHPNNPGNCIFLIFTAVCLASLVRFLPITIFYRKKILISTIKFQLLREMKGKIKRRQASFFSFIPTRNILSDEIIHFTGSESKKKCPHPLRRVSKFLTVHSPDKPEPKRSWLVREITNYKSQITNKFQIPNYKLQTKRCPADKF